MKTYVCFLSAETLDVAKNRNWGFDIFLLKVVLKFKMFL